MIRLAVVQRRVGLLFALFFLLLLAAAARAMYLGGPHSGALRRAAQSQQLTDETVPAQRGTITDRNGVPLAISVAMSGVPVVALLCFRALGRPSGSHTSGRRAMAMCACSQ